MHVCASRQENSICRHYTTTRLDWSVYEERISIINTHYVTVAHFQRLNILLNLWNFWLSSVTRSVTGVACRPCSCLTPYSWMDQEPMGSVLCVTMQSFPHMICCLFTALLCPSLKNNFCCSEQLNEVMSIIPCSLLLSVTADRYSGWDVRLYSTALNILANGCWLYFWKIHARLICVTFQPVVCIEPLFYWSIYNLCACSGRGCGLVELMVVKQSLAGGSRVLSHGSLSTAFFSSPGVCGRASGPNPALALPAPSPSPSVCHKSDLVRDDDSLMWTNCH